MYKDEELELYFKGTFAIVKKGDDFFVTSCLLSCTPSLFRKKGSALK